MFRVDVIIDDEWGSMTQNLVLAKFVRLEREIAVGQSLTGFITEALEPYAFLAGSDDADFDELSPLFYF